MKMQKKKQETLKQHTHTLPKRLKKGIICSLPDTRYAYAPNEKGTCSRLFIFTTEYEFIISL